MKHKGRAWETTLYLPTEQVTVAYMELDVVEGISVRIIEK